MTVVDGIAVMQNVSIGLQNESQAQITAGLEQGDVVIVYPSDEIQSGTRVRPVRKETVDASQ